jgi:hypothetical protein
VKKERNIVHTIKRRKANWIDDCLLKHVIERRTEGKRRRERIRKQILDDLKEITK